MEPESSPRGTNKKLLGIIGLIVIVAANGIGAAAFSQKEPTKTATTSTPAATQSVTAASPSSSTSASAATYKDGTFKGSGSYVSPGGQETVEVSLTVKDGVVTDSIVTTSANNPTGKKYQDQFIEGYKGQITGKNLDSIKLTKVSGSSLTSGGFNLAVAQIQTEAKA